MFCVSLRYLLMYFSFCFFGYFLNCAKTKGEITSWPKDDSWQCCDYVDDVLFQSVFFCCCPHFGKNKHTNPHTWGAFTSVRDHVQCCFSFGVSTVCKQGLNEGPACRRGARPKKDGCEVHQHCTHRLCTSTEDTVGGSDSVAFIHSLFCLLSPFKFLVWRFTEHLTLFWFRLLWMFSTEKLFWFWIWVQTNLLPSQQLNSAATLTGPFTSKMKQNRRKWQVCSEFTTHNQILNWKQKKKASYFYMQV